MARTTTPVPQGISEVHQRPRKGWRTHANPAATIVLGALLLAALLGAFGASTTLQARTEAARLEVHLPARVRTGELFEIRIRVAPTHHVGSLVVGLSESLIRDMTVNTTAPTASDEGWGAGEFRYAFGDLAAGADWDGKLDLQINPNLFGLRPGRIAVYDGDRLLASVDAGMLVLP